MELQNTSPILHNIKYETVLYVKILPILTVLFQGTNYYYILYFSN